MKYVRRPPRDRRSAEALGTRGGRRTRAAILHCQEPVTEEAAMNTIFADFNARTEAGYVRLNCLGSQEDIRVHGLQPSDWAWLSDTEVILGAQLAIDDRYGLVGVLDWDTLIHLDDEGADDYDRIVAELNPLITKEPASSEDEPRILERLTQLEHAAPPRIRDESQGNLAFRRALALRQMGKVGLARLEMKEARRARPDDPMVTFVYLDLLRLEDLQSAVLKARSIARSPDVPAFVLSACINILAMHAEQVSGDQFDATAEQVLAWCRRFDQAPDLKQVEPPLVALSYFNRGLVHLRAGRISLARQAFERAQQLYPVGPMLDEVTGLQTYDRHAREVAHRVQTIIPEQFARRLVAA
jgi:lipoprotein NlpI